MCILCGCDYCDTIRGIGQVKAYQFIQKYRTIEEVLKNLPDKYNVPDNWPYQRARELFKNPEVVKGEDIKITFSDIDRTGLKEFLVNDKGFNPERVDGYIEKLEKAKEKCKQKRMDSFFTVKSSSSSVKRSSAPAKKDSKKKKYVYLLEQRESLHLSSCLLRCLRLVAFLFLLLLLGFRLLLLLLLFLGFRLLLFGLRLEHHVNLLLLLRHRLHALRVTRLLLPHNQSSQRHNLLRPALLGSVLLVVPMRCFQNQRNASQRVAIHDLTETVQTDCALANRLVHIAVGC